MQKNILLSAVNAKYIHSSLAIRYLKKYCEPHIEGIDIAEFSINESINSILKRLYNSGAEIYGFSCYIWNISLILNLCSSLKKAKPEAVIILGGPEVSYDSASLLKGNPFIDYIIIGEGEETLLELLDCVTRGRLDPSSISGLAYREGENVVTTLQRPLIASLDTIPFPYDSLDEFPNKIVYFETSRGCPFNCQYCLSSTIHGVRYLSMARLRDDIKSFVSAGIKQIKLVDRTFNCDIDRSIEIMQYIMELNSATNFHFEIAADLINERFLETVEKAPEGMFQFEIGVQSTNPKTLSEIERKMNFDKVGLNVSRLISFNNTHIHLDLIAGLPYEDMKSLEKSFNEVYALKADMLQLGFLKLLKGSGIRDHLTEYGMEHHDFPPYEVIKTKWLSYAELLLLKDIEQVLEYYGNSGRFKYTLDFLLMSLSIMPFDFYHRLSDYWNLKGHFNSSKSINELFNILKHFVSDLYTDRLDSAQSRLFNEYLKLDWLLFSRSGSMPETIERFDHSSIKDRLQEFLKSNLTNMEGFDEYKNMPLREILKHVAYEVFVRDIFDINSSDGASVLFYPIKQRANSKNPFFIIIPLEKITPKG
ncbi:MAG TPA: B12-binding domain-containing radical SAM protein [Patescibacteria group bacterium]|nr:B12-binding domain-containing radical SAM protein [Patescibacteria group bacterium]